MEIGLHKAHEAKALRAEQKRGTTTMTTKVSNDLVGAFSAAAIAGFGFIGKTQRMESGSNLLALPL